MLKSYIPITLVRELQDNFPNHLPNENDYANHITPEQIAFRAGQQSMIQYIALLVKAQQEAETDNDIVLN